MKVYQIGKGELGITKKAGKPSGRSAVGRSPGREGSRGDRVCLSPEARRLLRLEKHLSASDDLEVRERLVASLQKRIQEGTYEPDSRKVAEKMIAEAVPGLLEE